MGYNDEANEQASFVLWLKGTFPDIIFSANISGTRRGTKIQRILNGKEAKRLGYCAGIPDITIYYPNRKYNGLLIEMKSTSGKARDVQEAIHSKLRAMGYCVVVCKGMEKAKEAFQDYILNKN